MNYFLNITFPALSSPTYSIRPRTTMNCVQYFIWGGMWIKTMFCCSVLKTEPSLMPAWFLRAQYIQHHKLYAIFCLICASLFPVDILRLFHLFWKPH